MNGDAIEFSDVCRYYLGVWGDRIAVLFSLISLLGAAIVFWVLMSNYLYNSVRFVYGEFKIKLFVVPKNEVIILFFIECFKNN